MPRINPEGLELADTVIAINRVSKVVKGGKRFSFNTLVVVGDKKGHVGVALGKAKEIQAAIRKAVARAKKDLIKIDIVGTSIQHEVIGNFGAAKVLLKPAAPGTGVIAGGPVRAILEAAGVKDILTKSLRTTNVFNVVYATMAGLATLRTKENIALLRSNKEHTKESVPAS